MPETSRLTSLIVRAVVHLNFHEPDQARELLLDALTDVNFDRERKDPNGDHSHQF